MTEQRAVDVEPLFRHAGVLVARWRCRVREAGATSMLEHRWHCIKFVHTGAFLAHLAEGTVHVDSTRTLLATPRRPYRVTRQFGPDVCGSAILIAPEPASEITGGRDESTTRLLREELTPRAILTQHSILRKIEECASPLVIAELGLTLAAEAFRDPSPLPRQTHAGRRDAVAMVQAILAANYEKPIRLEDVARAVDLSPFHLCRTFKRTTGVHMHQYLNRLRLRAALEQVAEPHMAFAEIAHDYGFSSQSHFAAAFRKEFRITPSEARRLATRSLSQLRHTLGFETLVHNFPTDV